MNNENKDGLKVKPSLLNQDIFLFVYTLLKYIFLKKNQSYQNILNNKLNASLSKINKEIIKTKEKHISKDYTKENLQNIIYFVKAQNSIYCGDIIENILIIIFSKVFYIEREHALYKFIFNNLNKIREQKNKEFLKWIKQEKLAPYEFNNVEDLLDVDGKENELDFNDPKDKSVFYNFLRQILKEKYQLFSETTSQNYFPKNMLYINNGNYFNYEMSFSIYNSIRINKNSHTILDKDIYTNSIMNIKANLSQPLSERNKPINQLILSFFSQVYIYLQNKNSPLLPYTIPEKDYATIPFTYDLRGACIEGRFGYVAFAPLRIGDFVSDICIKQNNLRENGLYELGKLSIFNNKVKLIECDTSLIRTQYIDFLTNSMGIYDNFSVEEINLSYNYLRENSEEYIIKICKKFKGLKTLNLSSNDLGRGLAGIFVVLKKLYRKKKSQIEILILNKCALDDSSFYELGELLKCKFCKLKKIYFTTNPLPTNSKFLQQLKLNKSLEEIYLNKLEITDVSIDDILRIISSCNIRTLYLFKNKLTNFNNFLRILFRTKIVKANKDKDEINSNVIIKNEDTTLINLDLSNNDYQLKNRDQIKLLKQILEQTTLYCLDICHILYGDNPEKKKSEDLSYINNVEEIKSYLEEQKYNYSQIIKDILDNEAEIKQNKGIENGDFLEKDKIEKYMKQIYNNEDSMQTVFLNKMAKTIIKKEGLENNKENVKNIVKYLVLENSKYNLKELQNKKSKNKLIII